MRNKELTISKGKRGRLRWVTGRATREELQSFILGTMYKPSGSAYEWVEITIPDSFPQTTFRFKRGEDLCEFLYTLITPSEHCLDANGRFEYSAKGYRRKD